MTSFSGMQHGPMIPMVQIRAADKILSPGRESRKKGLAENEKEQIRENCIQSISTSM